MTAKTPKTSPQPTAPKTVTPTPSLDQVKKAVRSSSTVIVGDPKTPLTAQQMAKVKEAVSVKQVATDSAALERAIKERMQTYGTPAPVPEILPTAAPTPLMALYDDAQNLLTQIELTLERFRRTLTAIVPYYAHSEDERNRAHRYTRDRYFDDPGAPLVYAWSQVNQRAVKVLGDAYVTLSVVTPLSNDVAADAPAPNLGEALGMAFCMRTGLHQEVVVFSCLVDALRDALNTARAHITLYSVDTSPRMSIGMRYLPLTALVSGTQQVADSNSSSPQPENPVIEELRDVLEVLDEVSTALSSEADDLMV